MDEMYEIGEHLKQSVMDFLLPLQTTREIRVDAFDRLHEAAILLMRACKGRELVPKALLLELQASYLIVRAEAPYFRDDAARLCAMADKIEICLSLILRNEVPEDRQPGVPRVI